MEDFTSDQLQKINKRAQEQAVATIFPQLERAFLRLADAANCLDALIKLRIDSQKEDALTIKLSGEEAYILREGGSSEVDGVIDSLAKQYKFTEFIASYLTKTRKEIE